MQKQLITLALVGALAGSAGFVGGMMYQKSTAPIMGPGQFPGGPRLSGMPNANRNFGSRPVLGKIVGKDEQTLTVETANGNKMVILSESTAISTSIQGTNADLKEGEQVMVIGNEGTQGTVTAQSISIGANILRPDPQ